jgi:2-polyprenyl-3-methyl-5-hydroxy-6-metoxy-1,4-benzoquinol methylase
MDLKELEQLGDSIRNHWYYRAKASQMEKLLGSQKFESVLDVGAGSGFFAKHLLENDVVQNGICVDPNYESNHDEIHQGKTLNYRKNIGSHTSDLVLMMDVLEHVDDDLELLRHYKELSKPGTTFLLTAPAFMFMWSPHDDFLGHYRRYKIIEFERLIKSAGLMLSKGSYFFAGVFPMAMISRLIGRIAGVIFRNRPAKSQMKNHSKTINQLLYRLCNLEQRFVSRNRLFGLSVFFVARKPI